MEKVIPRRTIALIMSSLDADYSRRLVAGATEVLTDSGFAPLCFSPGASGTTEYQIPHAFLDLVNPEFLSGLIFSPPSLRNVDFADDRCESTPEDSPKPNRYDTEAFLQRVGDLPVVCVGAWITDRPSLWVQNGAGIRLVMKHLTEACGRRRIAFIRGPENNVEAEARFRAWRDFSIEHLLPHDDDLVGIGDFTPPTADAAASRILARNPRELPDAFVVSNDRMAIGVMDALRRNGLSVPNDVSVVGFDDLEAESVDPPLTTVRQPVFEMGHRAAEVLIALLRNEPVSNEQMFAPELIVRASCRPNQRGITQNREGTGIGASVFLESAYPSAELLMPLLRMPLKDPPIRPHLQLPLGEYLTGGLEQGLQRSKVRERDLILAIRRMRLRTAERLADDLHQIGSLRELHIAAHSHLRHMELDRVTLALRGDPAAAECGVQIVVDCSATQEEPDGTLGCWLPESQVIADHVQSTVSLLRVAEPVYFRGKYCGFLLASGNLVDNLLLNQLGTVLTEAAMMVVR